jgi:hypothetical protein
MGQQTRAGESAVDRPRRCRGLHDPVAGIAAQLGPHMADDLEAGPDILQHLGHIFAQFPQTATAVRTGVVAGHVGMDFARKMLGQGAAERLRWSGPLRLHRYSLLFDGIGCAKLFELQLQLFGLAKYLLAPATEEHMLQLLDQKNEAFDLAYPRTQRSGVLLMVCKQQHLQRCRIESVQIGQAEGRWHVRSMT